MIPIPDRTLHDLVIRVRKLARDIESVQTDVTRVDSETATRWTSAVPAGTNLTPVEATFHRAGTHYGHHTSAGHVSMHPGSGYCYVASPVWQASTTYAAGDYVRPTSANGYVYRCVTAGDSDSSEPTWGTVLGADTSDGTAAWRCIGVCVMRTPVDLTDVVSHGTPLKYTVGSVVRYGVCVGIEVGYIAIAGPPVLATDTVTALSYGIPPLNRQVEYHVVGTYGNGVGELLAADEQRRVRWTCSPAHLAYFEVIHTSDDTGAAQPRINVMLDENTVSTDSPYVGETWTGNYWSSVDRLGYNVGFGSEIEIKCVAAGTNGDASDLSIMLSFVME